MAQTWPATVPTDLAQAGYNEAPPDNLIRNSMDAGPPKTRRRSTAGVRPINGIIKMTSTQLAAFDAWYNDDLANGALTFNFDHPRTGVTEEMQFSAVPTYTPAGGIYWTVGVQMQVMP